MATRDLRLDDSTPPVERLLSRLDGICPNGTGWKARCPAHDDREASLSVHVGDDGKVLLRCFTGCAFPTIMDALGLDQRAAFPNNGERDARPGRKQAVPPDTGCTLTQYADAKRLPPNALRGFGLTDMYYQGAPAVRIPYRGPDGTDTAARFRLRLEKSANGDDRFRWKSGAKVSLYGRDRLPFARERGRVTLVEGESDCHTLWSHDEPAVGIPGASNLKLDRDAPELDGIATIHVVVEPDKGGDTLLRHLANFPPAFRDRVRLVRLGHFKDPSALYLDNPDQFRPRWQAALDAATPFADELKAEQDATRADAWEQCADLARKPDILTQVAEVMERQGVVGERRNTKLLYLATVSRFLPRPASVATKGPSGVGKSYTLERVLSLFPADAYYALTAMSERALAYGDEPLAHRFLVIYEAAGLSSDFASYLLRSLLSEGRVRYETVEKTGDGLKPRLIEREGPTGLFVTTTAIKLHPENETRLLSLPVTDTPGQTRNIFHALANGDGREELDLTPWHALQTWLSGAEHRVVIPFAKALADAVPPVAVRLRRDFGTVLTLVRAHAILHQATRERDEHGRIIATLADYAAVWALVADLVAEGIDATVSPAVRETVTAVRELVAPAMNDDGSESLTGKVRSDPEQTVSVSAVAKALRLDKSAVSRRVRVATEAGYLKNLEDKKGRPAKLTLGEPLPAELVILPLPETLDGGEGGSYPPEHYGNTATPPEFARNGAESGVAVGVALPEVLQQHSEPRTTPCNTNLPGMAGKPGECCSGAGETGGIDTPPSPSGACCLCGAALEPDDAYLCGRCQQDSEGRIAS